MRRFDFRIVAAIGYLALVAVAGAQTVSKLSISPSSVIGGSTAEGTVTLAGKAGKGGVFVNLSSSSKAAGVGSQAVVPSGKSSTTFQVGTIGVSANTTATITAAVGSSSQSATLTVKAPTLHTLSLSPGSVVGGKTVTATAFIEPAAPAGGLSISLVSDNGALTAGTLTIAAGAKSGTATLTTSAVSAKTTVKVTATLGSTSVSDSVTVEPLTLVSLKLDPSTVVGGSPSTATLTISGPAPAAGFKVSITRTAAAITVPASVTVPSGASSTTFTVTTSPVSSKSSGTILARLANTVSATLTLDPVTPSPFAGKYSGSFYTTHPDLGTVVLTISNTGVISGTSLDIWNSDPTTSTLGGTVTNSGNVTLTMTGNGSTQTIMGTFTITNGLIVGAFPNTNGSVATVWINEDGKPLEYAGDWSGTFTNSSNDTGTTNIKISTGGVLSGTGKNATTGGTGTFAGTITPTGTITLTFKSSSGTVTPNTGGAAYNASDQLILYLLAGDGSGAITIVTLTKTGGGA